MTPDIKKFADAATLIPAFVEDLLQLIDSIDASQPRITVALSGGSTPKLLFKYLAENHADTIDWSRIHFFWGDDRCVAPHSPESNYGVTKALLLDHISIPAENVHRVRGEDDPQLESTRYAKEISETLTAGENGIPVFDLMLLGMGGDGHTASIFPHQIELMNSRETCVVATHPESGQMRVSLSGPVINASQHVWFLVLGESKASVLAEIFSQTGDWESYPTSFIKPASQKLTFYVDEPAMSKVSQD